MGATKESTNKIYLTTFMGMMVRRVAKGTPDAIMRINKMNDEVSELQFDTLTGYLDDIRLEEPPEANPEYGKSWAVVIEDGDEVFELKLGAKGREASAFLSRLPNLDFSKPIKVKTYWIQGEDKKYRSFLAIHQDGQKVEPYFSREEPNGLPQLESTTVDGVVMWDGSKQREFFLRMVTEKVLPKIKEERPLSEAATVEPPVVDNEVEVPGPTIENEPTDALDALPF